jgi:glucose-1-phosphate thymidylyltransferase
MKGLVLSGGTGTRLQPFTLSMPKQLIPVANRPVLSYILYALRAVGITEAGIITGDEGLARIPTGLRGETPPSLELTYIRQAVPLGLAHAVQTARPFLGDDDFIMVLGDNLFDRDLSEGMEIFKCTKADALLYLTPVADPYRYGIAEVKDGRIISLVEKPTTPRSNLAIMGIYLLSSKIFAAIARTRPSARGELEITDALQELLSMGGKIVPCLYDGWWLDVGKAEDVLAANRKVLDLLQAADSCAVAPSAIVTNSTLRGPLIIGEGCRISNAILGPYCSIGRSSEVSDARLEDCILCEQVVVRNLRSLLRRSIIGEKAAISGRDGEEKEVNLLLGAASELILRGASDDGIISAVLA